MRGNRKSILFLVIFILIGIVSSLFAGSGIEPSKEVPSFVKFVTFIFGQEPGAPADFFLFLGRFHPLVLHLPIGMLVVAFFMQAFAIWKKRDDFRFPYCFCLGCAFIFSVIAVIFGSFLAMTNDYNADLINRHGWGGLAFSILVGIAFFFKLSFIRSGHEKVVHKKISLVVMFLALNVMSFVGHDGGSLTHGEEYLFKYAPDPIRALGGFPPKPEKPNPSDDSSKLFVSVVKPFLDNYCVECHGSAKMKGKLRLDSIEHIMKGGKNENLIVPGKASESLFYQLMVTDDEDEVMPPEGKLADPYLKMVEHWINSAKTMDELFTKTIDESGIAEELRYVNQKIVASKKPAHAEPTENKVEEAKKAVEEVKEVAKEVKEVTKAVAEEMLTPAGAVDFMKDVAPIFESRCIKCHGEKKQKGEYRMDKAEFAFTAGDSEEAPIVKGDPAASYLVKLIKMSEDDDDVMPPKGGVLTVDQIAKIEAWIKAGADFPADVVLQDNSK